MKNLPLALSLILMLTLGLGCASTSSYVLVGTRRPPIAPSQVRLYLHRPAHCEEIALVSAASQNSFAISAQAKTDVAILQLKQEAARLGANGILLTGWGNQYAGTFGSGTGLATGSLEADPTALSWTGAYFSSLVFSKSASGIAIYVRPR